ncbi:hypothetical protein F5144DRAFT_584887 [Chaetomium tenue]|uniref:Uncharacterized protein n=1 Tax=Chaetomium tenue TaxID=1854479 RepID=A0ACB7P283_9PEZI|nr:hypothetical protein F5144DRAFT_584887 [Chaetomium globosum]
MALTQYDKLNTSSSGATVLGVVILVNVSPALGVSNPQSRKLRPPLNECARQLRLPRKEGLYSSEQLECRKMSQGRAEN